MDTEKSISQLVEEAQGNGKVVVLFAAAEEQQIRMIETIARMRSVATTDIILIPIQAKGIRDGINEIAHLNIICLFVHCFFIIRYVFG